MLDPTYKDHSDFAGGVYQMRFARHGDPWWYDLTAKIFMMDLVDRSLYPKGRIMTWNGEGIFIYML